MGESQHHTPARDLDVPAVHWRAIIADDDVPLRKGLARLLTRSGFEVVGQAGDSTRLVELVADGAPDLTIIDTRMPPTFTTEGLTAAQEIRERFPTAGILVLSADIEVEHALGLMTGCGSIGYLLKSGVTDVTEFVDALDRIVQGDSVIDSSLVRELVTVHGYDDPLMCLSPLERNVLTLMAEGRTDTGIGRKLGMAEDTVGEHVRGVFTKLCLPEADTDDRRALTVLAFLDSR